MIQVLICDDQEVVCEGLRVILGSDPDLKITGVSNNGLEVLTHLEQNHADVVLMDLKMPVMNGVQATKAIKERYKDVRVLVLTTFDADEWVFDAIRAGADGYLLKDVPSEQLITAIKDTANGKNPVDSSIAGKLFSQVTRKTMPPEPSLLKTLSERERDVLGLLAKGLSNAEIAQNLFLSEGTVRNYVSTIFTKLQVNDRTQLALLAIRAGIID